MQFIDTHAHIYSEKFNDDRTEMLQRAFEANVTKILMPNVDNMTTEKMLALADHYPQNCFPMMGLHPCSVDACFEKELEEMESWLSKRKFWGIGEMGLDLYWDDTFFEEQKQAFRIQANWAKKHQLPLIIHCREAMKQTIELLEELQDGNLFGILHCFTGTLEDAQKLIALHFKLGIGGVLTYKKSGLDEVLKSVDIENLVLETDCPYLAPVPHRGKRNETAYVPAIAQKLAETKGLSLEEIAQKTTQNAEKLFKL